MTDRVPGAPIATTWKITSLRTEGVDLLIDWSIVIYMPWPSLSPGMVGATSPKSVTLRHTERLSNPSPETVQAAWDIWSKSVVIRA